MEGLNLPPHIYVPSLLVPSYHCCLQDRPPAPPIQSCFIICGIYIIASDSLKVKPLHRFTEILICPSMSHIIGIRADWMP